MPLSLAPPSFFFSFSAPIHLLLVWLGLIAYQEVFVETSHWSSFGCFLPWECKITSKNSLRITKKLLRGLKRHPIICWEILAPQEPFLDSRWLVEHVKASKIAHLLWFQLMCNMGLYSHTLQECIMMNWKRTLTI